MHISRTPSFSGSFVTYLNRAIEALWLISVFIVPLTFFTISDVPIPIPSPFEVAKIGVFRTIVGIISVLWIWRWLLSCRSTVNIPHPLNYFKSRFWSFSNWLGKDTLRWIILPISLYLLAVVLSTIFSHNRNVSLWGETPGIDNYSAYNLVCYFVLFAVMATTITKMPQIWRLFVAIIIVGVITALYGILQFYGWDFLNIRSPAYISRQTSTFGNPIFFSSFQLLTLGVSITSCVAHLAMGNSAIINWRKILLWSGLISLQISAVLFSVSRGPSLGIFVALIAFFILLLLYTSKKLILSWCITLVFSMVFALLISFGPVKTGVYDLAPEQVTPVRELQDRISLDSNNATLVGSSMSQRFGIWRIAGSILLNRDQHGDNSLPETVGRHIWGVGPEIFYISFMSQTIPMDESLIPLETRNGHNYFLHTWVELGFLGFIAITGIFVALILTLFTLRSRNSLIHIILIIGLISTLIGRLVEQAFGIPKVSDLQVFWMLLAVIVAISNFSDDSFIKRRALSIQSSPVINGYLLKNVIYWIPVVVVTILIIFITWGRTLSGVFALLESSDVNYHFVNKNIGASVDSINRGLDITPHSYVYYESLGDIYSEYLMADDTDSYVIQNHKCDRRFVLVDEHRKCILEAQYNAYDMSLKMGNPKWQYWFITANSARELAVINRDPSLAKEALHKYFLVTEMVPNSYLLHNELANALLEFGNPILALPVIDKSLKLTGDNKRSSDALLLKGLAYADLGDTNVAIGIWSDVIDMTGDNLLAYYNRGLLYREQGELELAMKDYSSAIIVDSSYIPAYKQRADVYQLLDMSRLAAEDRKQVKLLSENTSD